MAVAEKVSLSEHVQAISESLPEAQVIHFEARVTWDAKRQKYILGYGYSNGDMLVRFTVRKPKLLNPPIKLNKGEVIK